eukprot:Lithocolla_globosa_v1_NODE_132_length_5923_cov_39.615883.p12 type:complete len:107 gc:universal NODE_132_length_5923_cov_39.615883:3837-3517(-)
MKRTTAQSARKKRQINVGNARPSGMTPGNARENTGLHTRKLAPDQPSTTHLEARPQHRPKWRQTNQQHHHTNRSILLHHPAPPRSQARTGQTPSRTPRKGLELNKQ